jgi:predicted PurR-regulated permease PerM
MRAVLPQTNGGLSRAGSAAWSVIGIAVVVLLAGWAIGRLMSVVIPFVIAILLTTLLRPLAARLERRGLKPALAAVVAVVLAIVVVALALSLVLPPFIARLSDLGSSVQEGAHRVAYEVGDRVAGMSHREVDRTIENAVSRVRDRLGGAAMAGVTSAAGALGSLVLIVFMSFFMVKDGRRIWGYLVGFAPEHRRAAVDHVGERAWAVLTAYTRGVVFVATVDAVLIGAALLLVGVPLALPLIVLTWVAAFFPIIGAVTAGAAAVLVALVANGPTEALIVLAAIVLVQQVEGNVLYPVVVGPRLRLHPIVVLMSVALGGTLAGIPGAFLAVPMATVIATVLTYLRERRDRRDDVKPAPRHGVLIGNGSH